MAHDAQRAAVDPRVALVSRVACVARVAIVARITSPLTHHCKEGQKTLNVDASAVAPAPRRAKRALALAASIVAVAAGVVACGPRPATTPNVSAPTPPALQAVPSAAAPGAADPVGRSNAVSDVINAAIPAVSDHGDPAAYEAILAAQRKLAEAEAFRIRQNTTTVQQTFPMTLTFVAPDRISMSSPALTAVMIGADGYYMNGATLTKNPAVVPTLTAAFDALRNLDVIERTALTISDATDLGTSKVNGVAARHYGYRVVAGTATTPYTSTFELWVGADDGRLIVQQVVSEASGVTSRSAQLVDYGPGLAVEGP